MKSTSSLSSIRGRDNRLMEQARALALPEIANAFVRCVECFDTVLFDRAEAVGLSRWVFLDGVHELRRCREDVCMRFREHLDVAWRAFDRKTPLAAELVLTDASQSSLNLLPEHVLESHLAVRHLATVLSRECEHVLACLEWRLGVIAGGVELNANSNPVGPEHIGVAVYKAFGTCELASEVRLLLIKLCERDLLQPLVRLYRILDKQLAKIGDVAQIVRSRLPVIHSTSVATPKEGSEGDEYGEQYASFRAVDFMDRWERNRYRFQVAYRVHEDADVSCGHLGGSQDVLLETLHALLQQTRSQREKVTRAVAVAQRPLSQREILSVLSLLQANPSATLDDKGESLTQRLKREVLSNVIQLGVNPAHAHLDPVDEDAIDLVGMLFDVMLDQCHLEAHSRRLMGRLLVPFVKVALLDRKMFVRKTHPARRLLNALADACNGNVASTPADRALLSKVEEIVKRLVVDFNENLAIFLTLDEEFREFLTQHRRRVEIVERRAAETQCAQEKLRLARVFATKELGKRLNGVELPGAIEAFMRQPWQHYLTMVLLREGEDGAGVAEALAVADGVLEELAQARRRIVAKPWLQAFQPGLLKIFGSVGLHEDTAQVAIAALYDTLHGIAASRPELETPFPEISLLLPTLEQSAFEPGQETVMGEFDAVDADRFRKMEVGTWLDFIETGGKVQTVKLSWISPISGRLLWVDRHGIRFCVASPEELAVMVRQGRLCSRVNDDAFDNAMRVVLDRLNTFSTSSLVH
ncbi:DUF1631 domain-containing protein [Xylella taiwanensis]|uniref:DUF1631 domain-containing protein n=1 Tax=Xylella taiwanensis TaxID=1444770 RepID=Z9JMZ1_9GAMM|nr:DUF1631 domain-containing protein [Xylella taiwanensis]AXI83378.1 thymidine phosphorylase [Xylella taiwanensis]EWS79107.1 hypothetical protein AF72_01105 [Xylella taiwanensis]MCD8456444.1 DUF1631 domain-containing protein [Xylella taiwanensis]MCD8458851.1 DUF1631 domain-containing protein [Xylella taiwanensis]MCD8460988.1 DUF1631 domain-containing protein [Xylella taiwanensis]